MLKSSVSDYKFRGGKLTLSSISDDQLLVTTSVSRYFGFTDLPNFLLLDLSRSPHDVAEHEASELEKMFRTNLAKNKSLADKYKDSTVSGFVLPYRRSDNYFLHGIGESKELGDVFLPGRIADDLKFVTEYDHVPML
jgi:hypothetical protein